MNPFIYDSIAQGDTFYDRTEETQQLVDTLVGGNNVVLFAPRRYGKTSLVFKAIDILQEHGIECVYFDLMPVYSLEAFVTLYLKNLAKHQTVIERFMQMVAQLKNIRPKLTIDEFGKPSFGVEFISPEVTIDMVEDVIDLPEKMAENGRRIVVIMDEFQEIQKFGKFNLEALLRSRIQRHKHTNYLFLGSKTHLMQDMFMAKNRPFYNSAKVMQLSTLPEKETVQFLIDRLSSNNIQIKPAVCKHIIACAENIPYYIQLLGAEIWQYLMPQGGQVTEQIVDECFIRVLNLKKDYYFELLDKLSVSQKKLLSAIAVSGKNIYSAQYIAANRLVGASSVQKSVVALMEMGILEREGETFFVGDPFLQYYILYYAL